MLIMAHATSHVRRCSARADASRLPTRRGRTAPWRLMSSIKTPAARTMGAASRYEPSTSGWRLLVAPSTIRLSVRGGMTRDSPVNARVVTAGFISRFAGSDQSRPRRQKLCRSCRAIGPTKRSSCSLRPASVVKDRDTYCPQSRLMASPVTNTAQQGGPGTARASPGPRLLMRTPTRLTPHDARAATTTTAERTGQSRASSRSPRARASAQSGDA